MTFGKSHRPSAVTMAKEEPASPMRPLFRRHENVLFLLLALFSLATAWNRASDKVGVDFYQFWAVGQWLHQHGNANVYSDDFRERLGAEILEESKHLDDPKLAMVAELRRKLETYSSPFLYTLFGLCSTGRYSADFRCYQLLMLACLVFGIGVLCNLLRYSFAAALGVIAVFSAWFQPFASDLRVGNVNCLQFAALAAYLWVVTRMRWRQRDLLGGALLGLAVVFKPNLVPVAALLAVYWAVTGQSRRLWLQMAGAAGGAIAAILFASADFRNFHCWTDWISGLRLMPDQIITVALGNFSPAQFLTELYGLNAVIPVAIIFAVVAVALLWSRQRNKLRNAATGSSVEESPGLFAVSIGCPLVVLMPRLAWLHYYVLIIPAILFLLRPSGVASSDAAYVLRQCLGVFALVVFAAVPLGITQSPGQQGALAVCAAVLLLFGHAIRSFTKASVSP